MEMTTLDVSGECKVSYVKTGTTVTKTKLGCQNLEIAGQYINPNKLFGVSVSSTSMTQYEISDGVIQSAQGIHHSVATVNIKSSINTAATAQQSLQLISSLVGKSTEQGSSIDDIVTHLGKDLGQSFSSTLLPSGTEVQTCIDNCQKPIDVLRSLKESLVSDKLATAESGKAFIKLLRTFRNTGKLTIEEILTNTDSYYIVPQLIDVGAATQTPFAQRAMMDLVQFEQDYSTEYPERLLLALAYSTHPGEYLLKDLINLMKKKLPNVNIQESVAMATGAVIHTYCQFPDQCQHEIVKKYKQLIRKMLKDCGDDSCTLRHLRSVGNAGLAEFLPELLTIAQNSKNPAVSLAAVQALRRMDKDFLKDQAKVRLVKMYLQITREYDSSVRVAALELLVQLSPTPEEIYSILKSALDNRKEFELSLYTMKRVLGVANSNNNVRESFLTALKKYDINNYNFFGHKGKSSAFTGLMADGKSLFIDNSANNNRAINSVSLKSSEEDLTLSFGSYRRNASVSQMINTDFGDFLELLKKLLLHFISEPNENIIYIADKTIQTGQKFLYMLYEDFTLNHQEKKIIILGQIFSTQEKRIHQKLCISKLNAKIQKTIDKMIKAGQKASEAFIIDICNEVLGNVFDIIEALNSIADISNGFVIKIFEEFKAVGLDRYIRILTDYIFHACTDDHIGPERHKSKNTKLRNNEHIQHEPLEALDLVGEIRQRSKSLLEVVSRITLTLLRLGLQVLKRSSYPWISDNDLILPKIREIADENLDLQRPLQSNSYMKRMSTFKNRNNAKGVIWNEEQIVKPEQLVAAGFSFDGKQDHVRCTSCECTSDVSKWNRNDDEYALSIHKGLAKDCIFVRTYGGSCMPEHVLPD